MTNEDYYAALVKLAHGTLNDLCWCQYGIGHPLIRDHSEACKFARRLITGTNKMETQVETREQIIAREIRDTVSHLNKLIKEAKDRNLNVWVHGHGYFNATDVRVEITRTEIY